MNEDKPKILDAPRTLGNIPAEDFTCYVNNHTLSGLTYQDGQIKITGINFNNSVELEKIVHLISNQNIPGVQLENE